MVCNPIITENQLDSWVTGNSQIAQGVIVDLIYHLVSASSPKPNCRRFQHSNSIGQHGPDGILETDRGFPPFVPIGKSYWEIGTGKNAGKKATMDYKSLTGSVPQKERHQSTFIFVTPSSGTTAWEYTLFEEYSPIENRNLLS